MNEYDLLRLPNGQIEKLNKLEIIYSIAQKLQETEKVNFGIVGRPTAPVFQPIINAQREYWESLDKTNAVEYGELIGEKIYRERMASALNRLYNLKNDRFYESHDVIFTSGGRIGIQAISYMFKKLFYGKKIVTTSLFYPDHTGTSCANDAPHDLLLVDVTKNLESLNGNLLNEALKNFDKESIGAFIFSDPNNPLGNIVGASEWKKIIEIFKNYPEAPIVIDEAYGEMVFGKPHESLISLAPKGVFNNIILLRSATKGFSVAGERMAILVSKNQKFLNKITEYHAANMIHCAKNVQNAYTCAMEQFDSDKQIQLANFYQPIVRSIENVLKEANLNIKNSNYKEREATFYVIGDFSKLLGQKINFKASEYYVKQKSIIENNIDIAMHILFEYKLALMPMHFFGADLNSGLIRITCSFKEGELKEVVEKFKIIGKDLEKLPQISIPLQENILEGA